MWVWWAIEFPLDDGLAIAVLVGICAFVFVGLVPIAGLVVERPVLPKWLWQSYFVAGFVLVVFAAVSLIGEAAKGSLGLSDGFLSLVAIGIHVGYLVALDAYLNRRPTVWAKR